MRNLAPGSLITCCLLLTGSAQAGTIITTNLPSMTQIVNIDATADGISSYSSDAYQSFFYQPSGAAPSLTLPAGTYTFSIINSTDAAAAFPSLTGGQLSQIYTAWSYNTPWSDNYLVFDSLALTNPSRSQLFDGAIAPGLPAEQTFGSAQSAYSGTVANGYYNKIRPAPPGRAGTASDYVKQYTFGTTTTLLFAIPDNILSDNAGGVSVVIRAVPEPSTTLALCIGGVAWMVAVRRHRRAAA